MQRISYRVALGGIITALCLLLMFLTGVMPLLYLALPMVAGALLLIIVSEIGTGWAVLTYAAVSLLSIFVTFDKEAALIFILFFWTLPHSPAAAGKAARKSVGLAGEMPDSRDLFCCGLLRHHLCAGAQGACAGVCWTWQIRTAGDLRAVARHVPVL